MSKQSLRQERNEAWKALVWIYQNGFQHSDQCPASVQKAFSDAYKPVRAKANKEARA